MIETVNDTSDFQIRPSVEHPSFRTNKMDSHQAVNLPLVVVVTAQEFRRFRQRRAQGKIKGEVKYKDILDRDHALTCTALLKATAY